MANTYSQINIHCVFAVRGRANVLTKDFRNDLHQYMSAILRNAGAFPLAVGGWIDHVHVFFELRPNDKIADLMRVLKASSSKWINENNLTAGAFQWQEGYGSFSYSRSQRDNVIRYIMNQETHHGKQTFREEYLELLKKFEIDFNDDYLFDFYD
jgi:putative transposase